jgi:hypothetical protein
MENAPPDRYHPEVSMAKKSKTSPVETAEGAGSDSHGREMPSSKSEAPRLAIAAGCDGTQVGAGYIRGQFGLDISPEHFSAVKSADKRKLADEEPKGKPGRRPKAVVEGYPATSPEPPTNGQANLLAPMEAIRPLVESMGKDQVKRLVALLG